MSAQAVTLLTDYGPHSEHVGALHAVLVAVDPRIVRVDAAHDIPPGEIVFGAVVLARMAALLPGAVHLAVVDPGVGGPRRPVAVALAGGGALVGPDNGLLGLAARQLGAERVVVLPSSDRRARTFDGRDVFAPAAARLALGTPLEALGVPADVASLRVPDLPGCEVMPGAVRTGVLGWDRFGNVQLSADASHAAGAGLLAPRGVEVRAGGHVASARMAATFGDVREGELLAYPDSHGHLAIAVNGGNAARRLGIRAGDPVELRATPDPGG